MDFVFALFPEAKGSRTPAARPIPPGQSNRQEVEKAPRFTRAQPMQFSLDSASSALLRAVDSSRPSLARFPKRKFFRTYSVSGHEEAGQAAKVNPDLALALSLKSGEPHASVPQADMARLESSLAHMREAQNFTFWCFGAFFRLFSSVPVLPEYKSMADQLFNSIQKALVDQAKESAVALANIKALRRESYLRYLPASFTTSTKMDLRKSALDSGLLFDQDRVTEALARAEKTASLSFQQAAAKALSKPRPSPGTPLVERGARTSLASSSTLPPRSGPSRYSFSSSKRDRGVPRTQHRSTRPSPSSSSNSRGGFFRK